MGEMTAGVAPQRVAAQWMKSSRCEANTCVEVARASDAVSMRNTVAPDVRLTFSPESWRGFLAGVAAGDFDRD